MPCERRRSPTLTGFMPLTLAGLLCVGTLACSSETTPPAEVRGTWFTAAQAYADRTFTITDSTITLHQGEGRSVTHRIRTVRREPRSGWTDYSMEYEQAGSRLNFGFQYFAPGEIRLRNLEHMVWKRVD